MSTPTRRCSGCCATCSACRAPNSAAASRVAEPAPCTSMACRHVPASRRSAASATSPSPPSKPLARRRRAKRCSRRGATSRSCNAAIASRARSCRPWRCSRPRRSRAIPTSMPRWPATSAAAARISASAPQSIAPQRSPPMRDGRRNFVKTGAAVAGGLVINLAIPLALRPSMAAAGTFAPNAFIRIDHEGVVTLVMPMVEMGQGIYTAMAMLLAEELEVGLDQVRIEHAPPDDALYANAILQSQTTGLSSTIRAFWTPLRQAGAMARTMLVAAAAKQWSVDGNSCQAQRGAVVHAASSRRLTYGDLVDTAATLPVPVRESVVLKPLGAMSLIGTSTKRIEGPEKVNGRTEFGIDVRLAGMKIASIAVSPVLGGRATRVDEQAALSVRGVRQVVNIDEAVAVVADHMWAARKGLKAAAIQWDDGPNASVEMTTIVGQLEEAARHPGAVARNEGDADKALAGAAQRLDAVYQMPFLAHAAMEPMNCTGHYAKDGCDIWLGTQAPTRTQSMVADLTGLPKTAIRIHNHFLGGGCSSRHDTDGTLLAVKIARRVDGPVKVVWSREEDIRHAMYRPYYYDRVSAGLDGNGHPIAWTHRIAGSSVVARYVPSAFKDGLEFDVIDCAAKTPYAFPNMRVEYVRVEPPGIQTAFWRGVWLTHNVFVVESFIDELAHAAKQDPFLYRKAHA